MEREDKAEKSSEGSTGLGLEVAFSSSMYIPLLDICQGLSNYKGGWEFFSIQKPKRKINGVIFVIGPYSGQSAGMWLQCCMLGRYHNDVS